MSVSAKKILSTKIAFFALLILLALAANVKYKQWKNQKAIDSEKDRLIRQTRQMENSNTELKNSLSYLNSESYKERVAKEQLNLKKSDEIVFGFSGPLSAPENSASSNGKNSKSNTEKWLEYFTQR